MTPAELEVIGARLSGVPDGPWQWIAEGNELRLSGPLDPEDAMLGAYMCPSCVKRNEESREHGKDMAKEENFALCLWPRKPVADFIAHARADVPALLAHIESTRALTEAAEEYEAAVTDFHSSSMLDELDIVLIERRRARAARAQDSVLNAVVSYVCVARANASKATP